MCHVAALMFFLGVMGVSICEGCMRGARSATAGFNARKPSADAFDLGSMATRRRCDHLDGEKVSCLCMTSACDVAKHNLEQYSARLHNRPQCPPGYSAESPYSHRSIAGFMVLLSRREKRTNELAGYARRTCTSCQSWAQASLEWAPRVELS